MVWVIVVLLVFIFQIITILFSEYRHPAKALAWLTILFFLPVIGFVMYYFLAKGYTQRRKVKRKTLRMMKELRRGLDLEMRVPQNHGEKLRIQEDLRLFGLLDNLPGSIMTKCNEIDIFNLAHDTYKHILSEMEQAADHIHLEYYTIRDDEIGRTFRDMLIRKAKSGVEVRVIYDGIGSMDLSDSYLKALHEAGVKTGCFLPPFIALIDKRLNYRNHRKIVVIDGKIGYLGGVNIGDEYLGKNSRLGFWRDTHLRIVGDSVYYLQHTFIEDWYFVTRELLTDSRYMPEHDCKGQKTIQIVNSGPNADWDSILEVYFSAIATAKSRIYITTPYFIPEPGIMLGLKTAAVSGVDVRIIIPYVPDTQIVYWASLSYVEDLLQAGVRFYQYRKGFIHAKVLIADEMLATVGTANMDMRSFFSNFEQNAILYDKSEIERLAEDFNQDLRDSTEIILEEFERRSRLQKGKEKFSRLLSPLF